MRQQIFIGSSSAEKKVAVAIQANLQPDYEVTVWDQGVFELTVSLLGNLLSIFDRTDAAIVVATPDDVTFSRGAEYATPRDNVLLELGIALGHLGAERTFLVAPEGSVHLPTDMGGIKIGRYSPDRMDDNLRGALGPVCDEIADKLQRIGPRRQAPAFDDALLDDLRRFHVSAGQRLEDAVSAARSTGSLFASGNPDGLATSLRGGKLRVSFGRIEDCDTTIDGSVVVLPANEFFDDACFNDSKSSLGAYFAKHFGDATTEVRSLIAKDLRQSQPSAVERESKQFDASYGVGRCVYLPQPLGTTSRIILVSTTTMRSGEGLQAEPHFVFAAIRAIAKTMSLNRLSIAYMPLLGSGYGVLSKELALLYMILAIKKTAADGGHGLHYKSVKLVVFQPDADSEPDISEDGVRAIIAMADRPS